jgi:Ca2+-binding RTX toxin-like protein
LFGADGDDTLVGGKGNDRLSPAEGLDIIDGGEGFDTLDYLSFYETEAVYVNLATGEAKGGHAEGDKFTNIEAVRGTRFDDILIGNADDNVLRGEDGDDIIFGNGGHDKLIGGGGSNTFIIRNTPGKTEIEDFSTFWHKDKIILIGFKTTNLDELLSGSESNTIKLSDVHSLTAEFFYIPLGTFQFYNHSDFTQIKILTHKDDNFVADKQESYLILAENGDDQIEGNSGDDEIHGGKGNDIIKGGAGDDLIYGDEGDDYLYGGAGSDIFAYKAEKTNGHDIIYDFNVTEDKLSFQGYGNIDYSDTQDLKRLITANSDGNLVFTLDAWSVTLIGIGFDQLENINLTVS